MSWAGFLFDTGIVWLLSWRRTRPFAYGAVIVFHAMTSALFPIGMFPVIMMLSALVFFAPDWPRRLLAHLAPRLRPCAVPVPFARSAARARTRWIAAPSGSLAYCALHVAVPLRHVVYPGSVLWHEQGMRWSWRVMVREKNGSVTFHVRDKRSGREWQVTPRRYLTRQQEQELSGQPDLILQLAHHVREEFTRQGRRPRRSPGRRARLAQRAPSARADRSEVDLGAVSDGVLPARMDHCRARGAASAHPSDLNEVAHVESCLSLGGTGLSWRAERTGAAARLPRRMAECRARMPRSSAPRCREPEPRAGPGPGPSAGDRTPSRTGEPTGSESETVGIADPAARRTTECSSSALRSRASPAPPTSFAKRAARALRVRRSARGARSRCRASTRAAKTASACGPTSACAASIPTAARRSR